MCASFVRPRKYKNIAARSLASVVFCSVFCSQNHCNTKPIATPSQLATKQPIKSAADFLSSQSHNFIQPQLSTSKYGYTAYYVGIIRLAPEINLFNRGRSNLFGYTIFSLPLAVFPTIWRLVPTRIATRSLSHIFLSSSFFPHLESR